MPTYVRLGDIPRKRHIQFRKADGSLYTEEVFGTRGFSGPASTLYHHWLPTEVEEFEPVGPRVPDMAPEEPLHHVHLKTAPMAPCGDPVSGRTPLFVNSDVSFGICRPAEPMDGFYKNADGDDLLFVHEGEGTLSTMFGPLDFGPGDYIVIPRGTIYTLTWKPGEFRFLAIESASPIETPRRYRNEYGQLLEHAPYCERDIRVPGNLETRTDEGRFEVRIKRQGFLTSYFYRHHPFDLVGWDGYVYPWAFNIGDFEPVTGLIHQPPPAHQTFEGHNFVVCSFCPRALDYHPEAIPIPYNHSNLDSDEVIYYVNGNFTSRRGIEQGSITLHPSGIPHGPQPGAVEASLGKTHTDELAVMVDTFKPLKLTRVGRGIQDDTYPFSWKRRG